MKIKALLATLIGAVAVNGATAGTWCPPAKDKCAVEPSPDCAGSISVGYETDYIWKGVRFARDFVWSDVNYTFELPVIPLTTTIGVWHGTDLSSNSVNGGVSYGDETDLYAKIGLPEMMGVSSALTYTHYLFPTSRTPSGSAAQVGDSFGSIGLSLSKELCHGITLVAGTEYYLGGTPASADEGIGAPVDPNADYDELSAWYHYAGATYSQCITDCIGVELSAGVAYSDGLWTGLGGMESGDSGWNHYYVKAGLPIALGCKATLLPYIGYNGTPDGWVAGNTTVLTNPGANQADAFHGGVSIKVGF